MSGKGSKARPFSVDQDTFSSNWDRIFNKMKDEYDPYESDNPLERPYNISKSFWKHSCKHEGDLEIQVGEPCNWCGMKEDGSYD